MGTTDRTSLGDRMKRNYESASRHVLPWRMPVIVRCDGKAFHSWTAGLARPFSRPLIDAMDDAAVAICTEMHGAVIAYVQSDEISVLLHGYKTHASMPVFDNVQSKIETIVASIASAHMTAASPLLFGGTVRHAYFDARAFCVPVEDCNNAFLWRQLDASRNSVSMMASSMFSHRELHGKSTAQRQEMIYARSGQNWNDLPVHLRRGRCVIRESYDVDGVSRSRWVVDRNPPIFSADPSYIERLLLVDPEVPDTVPRWLDAPDDSDATAAKLANLEQRRAELDAEIADLRGLFEAVPA